MHQVCSVNSSLMEQQSLQSLVRKAHLRKSRAERNPRSISDNAVMYTISYPIV